MSYKHYIVFSCSFNLPWQFTTILNVHCFYKNVSTQVFSFSKKLFLYSSLQHPLSHINSYFIENSILPLTLSLFQTYLYQSMVTSFLPICQRGMILHLHIFFLIWKKNKQTQKPVKLENIRNAYHSPFQGHHSCKDPIHHLSLYHLLLQPPILGLLSLLSSCYKHNKSLPSLKHKQNSNFIKEYFL